MPMIPRQIIDEIKYRSDITDVIGSYVSLKRAGSNMKGLCPFHNERTPSFTVYESSSSFYCFGCGAGGDVVTFIMRMENLTYRQALELLAKRAGIEIPEENEEDKQAGVSRERIFAMNLDAAKFFRDQLYSSPVPMEYLTKRGYSQSLIRHFGLGYAPDKFGALTDHMRSLGYSDSELAVAFLCGISRRTGKPFDYFRGRVIIPIIDTQKNVIAFGGRVLDDSQPKYLNTSDTPAFKKSRNLFALNFAKTACSEQMILCEGYMDVIALHGAGFTNAVATLGTSITPEHARIMKRYTKKVLIAYDVDEAGQKAADKAFRLFGEVGLEAGIIRVKDAKDPDEYIKKFGPERFRREILEGSESRFDFQTENILKKYDVSDQSQKIEAVREFVAVIAEAYSDVEREIYIRSIAQKLDLPYESLKSDVRARMRRNWKKAESDESARIKLAAAGYGASNDPARLKSLSTSSAEDAVLGLMMKYPEYAEMVRSGSVSITADCMRTDLGKRLFEAILSSGGDFSVDSLNETFTPEEMGRITRMIISRENLTNDEAVFRDCAERLASSERKSPLNGSGNTDATIDEISAILRKKRGAAGPDEYNNRENDEVN